MKASLRAKNKIVSGLTIALGAFAASVAVPACSTTKTLAPASVPGEIQLPPYAYLQHPGGYTAGDVRLLFTDPSAPKLESIANCQKDVTDLLARVQSIDERAKGMRELVAQNPVSYHWCFYSQILKLEDGLAQDQYVDEKQKRIISAYEFLVPVAQAFMKEFQDSRYIRWAIRDYRRLADVYFYRKLEISPQMSSELVDVAVPYQPSTTVERSYESRDVSVLEKYKIGGANSDAGLTSQGVPAPTATEEAPPAPALPAPVAEAKPAEAPAVSAEDEKTAAETLRYAQELAKEQKTAAANRAPAGVSAPAGEADLPAPPASMPLTAPFDPTR